MADRIVKIVLRGDISGLQASMKSAQGLMKNTADGITSADREAVKFREGLTAVGASATRMGLVAAAGVALVTKAAMDWESAWAGVTKTVDGTPAQLSAIEQGLRSMTGELPATHRELAGIAEAAGQLGVGTDSILAFTRTMADLAETTNLSADEAATSIAQFMNVMQTAPEDVGRLGSTLVELGNNGASTERDIIQMAQNIAGAGAIVGATEADILALSNAMASVGIEAEAGGTSVSKILIDMSTAVQTQSKELETWAATAGMTTEQFSQAFSESPVAAFDAFTKGLGRINEEGGNVFGLLESLGQSDVRVTRALLGMANSGDLLAESLSMGSAEWERNTALADEAAQRYDTTAAQASMAWNEIKDSAIDAGQGMLPVVAAVADSVGTVADAFQALPDPVKSSTGILLGVGAAALLTVGGVAKMVTTVTSAREALGNLGEVAPRSATLLGRVGRAAGIAAAAFATLQVAGSFLNSGDRAGVNTFTKALLELEQGAKGASQNLDSLFQVEGPGWGWIAETYEDINGLGDAIDALDPGKWESFRSSFMSKVGFETRFEAATKSFDQVDAALTSLVQSGAIDEADSMFQRLADRMSDAGMSSQEIAAVFPEYQNALDGLSDAERDAADAASEMAAATESAAARMGMSAEEYTALQESAQATADSFRGLGESLSDAEVSMGDWLSQLEEQNEALAEFTANSIKAANEGLDEGLIASLQEAGPEGALRLKQLADASEEEIGRANAAWREGEEQASRYSDVLSNIPPAAITEFSTPGAPDAIDTAVAVAQKYNLTPDQVQTIMEALDFASADIGAVRARLGDLDGRDATVSVRVVGGAQGVLAGIQAGLNGLRDRTVTVTTRNQTANATGGAILRATGGSIIGAGTGTSDSIPAVGPGGAAYRLSNGEHVLTAEEVNIMGGQGAVYAWRAALKQQRAALAYAGGGSVGSSSQAPGPAMSFSLVGARVEFGKDGIGRFVDGRIELGVANQSNYAAGQRRAGRRR